MQSNKLRRYSIIEGNAVKATGTLIQCVPTSCWPYASMILELDSPIDKLGEVLCHPINHVRILPTQEEANVTLGQDKADYIDSKLQALERSNSHLIKAWDKTTHHNEKLKQELSEANQKYCKLFEDFNSTCGKYNKLIKSWNETIKELNYLKQHNEELRLEIAANKETIEQLTKELKELRINYTQKI